mgnify:CR=1 FL=1
MARVVIIGQQDFGKAVIEAMIAVGHTIVGVFCKRILSNNDDCDHVSVTKRHE